jgi:Uma2 family endonuclease
MLQACRSGNEDEQMAQDMLAPWAELVPGMGPMTVDGLLALPDDELGGQYELVEGRLVRMPPSGGQASRIAMRLGAALLAFVDRQHLGAVTGQDGAFDLTRAGDPRPTLLAPDVAYVRAAGVPPADSPVYARAWPVAPDIAAEVASPNQYRPELGAKARRYLDAGVQLVWVIWPARREVDLWRPGAQEPVQTLTIGDAFDGLDVLPGFTYPLADLFD